MPELWGYDMDKWLHHIQNNECDTLSIHKSQFIFIKSIVKICIQRTFNYSLLTCIYDEVIKGKHFQR